MIAGILREMGDERRVALLPGEAASVIKLGLQVIVEKGAGINAYATDDDYRAVGVSVVTRKEVFTGADLLLTVNPMPESCFQYIREGQMQFTVLDPFNNREWIEGARKKRLTVFALDLIPRISRAQSMDILSSMATVAGYQAVLEAAALLPRFFPMFMSAAGTIKPAKVLILGAGVAGLQAIAVARKLGAVVEVFDVRAAVKEEVKSLGGRFIEVEGALEDAAAGGYAVEQSEDFKKRQQELIQERAAVSDVIIATAQIPGKKAPVLVLKETVERMKHGSVIIDLAASSGGNCEVTANGKTIVVDGVTVVGRSDYPSSAMASDASRMFGNNVVNLLKLITDPEGNIVPDFEDELIKGTVALHMGEYLSPRIEQILNIKQIN